MQLLISLRLELTAMIAFVTTFKCKKIIARHVAIRTIDIICFSAVGGSKQHVCRVGVVREVLARI